MPSFYQLYNEIRALGVRESGVRPQIMGRRMNNTCLPSFRLPIPIRSLFVPALPPQRREKGRIDVNCLGGLELELEAGSWNGYLLA
jgi:hypothetical protein